MERDGLEEIHKERICHQITDAHTLTNLTSINHSVLGRVTDPAKKDPDSTLKTISRN